MPGMPLSELKALLDSERNDALAATRASKLSVERSDATAGFGRRLEYPRMGLV